MKSAKIRREKTKAHAFVFAEKQGFFQGPMLENSWLWPKVFFAEILQKKTRTHFGGNNNWGSNSFFFLCGE